jgi:hypothetical protein
LFAQADVSLVAGDYVAVSIYQNSGGVNAAGAAISYFAVERIDGAIAVPTSYPAGAPTVATTPPASPVDGQIWILPVDSAAGVMWQFRYNAGSASAYKWEFIGGPPKNYRDQVGSARAAPTAYASMSYAVSVPRSGDYWLRFGGLTYSTTGPTYVMTSASWGANAADDNRRSQTAQYSGGNYYSTANCEHLITAAAGDNVNTWIKTPSGDAYWIQWFIQLTPVRVA